MVTEIQSLLVVSILINVNRQYRTKEFGFHGRVARVMGLDNRRSNEISRCVITGAATDHIGTAVGPGGLDVSPQLIESRLIDDRAHEIGEIGHVSIGNRSHLVQQTITQTAPETLGNVGATGGTAFLIVIQDPKLPSFMFDAVIAPQHDAISGKNVIKTIGALNRISQDFLLQKEKIIDWIKVTFHKYRRQMKGIDWGPLFDEFGDKNLDSTKIEEEISC